MSLKSAEQAALALLRAGVTPDASAIAQMTTAERIEAAHQEAMRLLRSEITPDASALAGQFNLSKCGAESVINDAYDKCHIERFGPVPKPVKTSKPRNPFCARRMAEERGLREARQIPRSEAQR